MKFIQFRIGDIVQMKKKHPCGSQEWEVLQLGSDMRIKCCGCGHIVLIPRPKFLKGAKKVLNRDSTQDTPLAERTSEFEGEEERTGEWSAASKGESLRPSDRQDDLGADPAPRDLFAKLFQKSTRQIRASIL